jgi:tetratricopeptide (TPR) repeat protein
MTLVPALVFGALELGLRLFGYGYPTNFFLATKIDGQTVYVENDQFARRFFPPGMERTPSPFVLPADKQAGTYRIFILGESAAQGFPDPSYNFGRILEVLLRQQYPQTRFEVINTAMTAINSHVLLSIAQDSREHQPDLFIVYAGNNEVVGPYGVANVLGPYCPSRSIIRANLFAKSLKTGQLLSALVQAAQGRNRPPRTWGGMAMFLESQVQETDTRLAAVHDHFRANLQDICSAGRDSGAQVLLCTVATNLKDCAPFASLHGTSLTDEQTADWDRAFGEGVRAESAGRYADAIACYEQAAELDAEFAELQFRWGHCLEARARWQEARDHYRAARDLDTLRFRADSRIKETIRAVAEDRAGKGVYLVDVEQAFAQASPHGMPGEVLFYEHVHMNFSGNYVLARSVLQQLNAVLPDTIRSQAVEGAVPLSEAACAERLGFTAWNQLQIAGTVLDLMNSPPFTHQIDHAARRARWQRQAEGLRHKVRSGGAEPLIAVYRKALQLAEKDVTLRGNFATMLAELGDTDGAVEQWQIVLRQAPREVRAHLNLANLLAQKGRFPEAIAHGSEGLRLAPRNPHAHITLGRIRASQGELEQAVAAYDEALRLNPMMPETHAAKADVLAKQGKTDEAIAAYAEAVRLKPDYQAAHQSLAFVLFNAGRFDEAIEHYSEVVRLDPENMTAHANLGNVLTQQREFDQALAEYDEALRIQPDNEPVKYNRAIALATAGPPDSARQRAGQV